MAEEYLIYLRKSQLDRDQEKQSGVFDTLQRHRDLLLQLARDRGYSITQIYEEVVSGDTIADRPEMQKLLLAVESGKYEGVLVMEIARLARGNTRDQGIVSETFLYSETKIITPDRIYDSKYESDEEYLEFELFMARREYKAINRRQQRGRIAALSEGKYIASVAPYGYERIKTPNKKGYTLKIVEDKAEIVREIFDIYTLGELQPDGSRRAYGAYTIATILQSRAVPSPSGRPWTAAAVKELLQNPTYAGYVRWGHRAEKKQMLAGEITSSHPLNKDAILYDGIHPAIISRATWAEACRIRQTRAHSPVPSNTNISNPLAGLLRCSHCGRSMVALPPSKGRPGKSTLIRCPTTNCPTVAATLPEIECALITAMQAWLDAYRAEQEAESPLQSSDTEKGLRKTLARLAREKEQVKAQQDKLYDLLEQGLYDKDTFISRSRALSERLSKLENTLTDQEARILQEREARSQREKLIPSIERAIKTYASLPTPAAKNRVMKEALDSAIYSKTIGGRWAKSDLSLYIFPLLPHGQND